MEYAASFLLVIAVKEIGVRWKMYAYIINERCEHNRPRLASFVFIA